MSRERHTLDELGVTNRRGFLKAGLGVVAGAAAAAALPAALPGRLPRASAAVTGAKISDLTGPGITSQWAAPYTDLGIPALCPDGSMLFVGGDTFDGTTGPGGPNWRAPVGLRSSSSALGSLRIDSAVGGASAVGLVPEGHVAVDGGNTTAIPSDVFTVGDTMYMHLMRGVIYDTDHTDFWKSTDNGNTWTYLCQWDAGLYGGQFQQKTYAVGGDGYCYVLSTVFNRQVSSGLLLHRVPQGSLGTPSAYQPWGYDNGWAWGNAPTTINGSRDWGEICFRAVDGRYAFTWLNLNPNGIHCQVFDSPISDLTVTPEQTMIVLGDGNVNDDHDNVVSSDYGGFIVPGSTLDDFHIVVSQWPDAQHYRFMHYRIAGLAH